MLLVAVGAFVVGQRIQSPAQAIADAAPPARTILTVQIEERQLIESITFRADVVLAEVHPVVISSSEAIPIVTEVFVLAGQDLEEGMTLLAVNGTPIVALEGVLPFYRDLTPYAEGPDVTQLQQALTRLGYEVGDPGVLDETTQQAAVAFFDDRGLAIADDGYPELDEAVRAGETAVSASEDASLAARDARSSAEIDKQASIAAATDNVEAAETQADLVEIQVDQSVRQAEASVAEAEALVQLLEQEDPVDEEVLAAARAELVVAQDAHTLAVAESDVALQQASQTIDDATRALESARGTSLADLQRAVVTADGERDRAEAALSDARRAAGVVVRREWFTVVPNLPARISSTQLRPGMDLSTSPGPVLELSNGELLAVGRVDEAIASRLSPGLSLEASDGTTVVEATIADDNAATRLTLDATEDGSDDQVVIEFLETPPEAWSGLNVKVTAVFDRTDQAVMAVPVTAIYADAQGGTYVRRISATGTVDRIGVATGVVAEGYVEIRPLDTPLAVGEAVEIGKQQP